MRSGHGWEAKGMLQVALKIQKSIVADQVQAQLTTLKSWVKEILDGAFAARGATGLVPNYIAGGSGNIDDAAASSVLAAVAYRAGTVWPTTFSSSYIETARARCSARLRQSLMVNAW